MYTLGIETSCDETSCAVLRNYHVLSNITISSLNEHKKYGGVVPEIATRAHLENIDKVFSAALSQARISLKKVGLVTVTYKPGLIGALVVGFNFAKALAFCLHKPFLGVNHLHAHLFAPFLNSKARLSFPFLGLVVSGGHTEIYRVDDFSEITLLGQTKDDACGEVYDKISTAYGLGYPGGPAIDKLFNPAYKQTFQFKCGRDGLNLSFSGIKTALVYKKLELEKKGLWNKKTRIKLVSSFQHAAISALVEAILEAVRISGIKKVVCGGGVAANSYLRSMLHAQQKRGVRFLLSPLPYTSDNAAIVAGLGFYLYNTKKQISSYDVEAQAHYL